MEYDDFTERLRHFKKRKRREAFDVMNEELGLDSLLGKGESKAQPKLDIKNAMKSIITHYHDAADLSGVEWDSAFDYKPSGGRYRVKISLERV